MMMNAARRRLFQDEWTTFEECLPDISHVDALYGLADRRPVDVITLRVEVLSKRAFHLHTETEASTLIQRAEMIEDNEWQRFYYLTLRWYFLGCAQYFQKDLRRTEAMFSFEQALHFEDMLRKADFNIFDAERVIMSKYMDELESMEQPTE
jgi:hypothetical protein